MSQSYEGKRVPNVTFRTRVKGDWKNVTTDEIFKGKTVVVFSLPGGVLTCTAAGDLAVAGDLTGSTGTFSGTVAATTFTAATATFSGALHVTGTLRALGNFIADTFSQFNGPVTCSSTVDFSGGAVTFYSGLTASSATITAATIGGALAHTGSTAGFYGATPTVRPSPMLIVPRTSGFGVTVATVPVSGVVEPSVPVAVPRQL